MKNWLVFKAIYYCTKQVLIYDRARLIIGDRDIGGIKYMPIIYYSIEQRDIWLKRMLKLQEIIE